MKKSPKHHQPPLGPYWSSCDYLIVGSFNIHQIEAFSEGHARRKFHKIYNGQSILEVIREDGLILQECKFITERLRNWLV